MNVPLRFYEFVAYVFPGASVLALLVLLPGRYTSLLAKLNVVEGLAVAIVLGFIVGHLLQSIVGIAMFEMRKFNGRLRAHSDSKALGWGSVRLTV